MPRMDAQEFDGLAARARALAAPGRRRILGIAGAPGAGKSTLAERLVDRLDGPAVLVPMDGFHLAQAELERLGRAGRKGAPDTFDAAGYAALLARLRAPEPGTTVYAPAFDRTLEEPIAGAIPVGPEVPLIVTEGNYLLHDEGAWAAVLPLLDEAWYLDLDARRRVPRLVERHVRYGKDRAHAERWVQDSDEANARLIERGRDRAQLVVTMSPYSG
ncbi:nucleoside/nucleotide kinase family protein [Streptomyces sp. NPDC001728]|uniref:nucleoside/nucleotide kinase family protein n=1 Tax=Streptomyces sp. NPDC001728 TaxID=3154396 RepID=UPI0033254B5D